VDNSFLQEGAIMSILSRAAIPVAVTVATIVVCAAGIREELKYTERSACTRVTAHAAPQTEAARHLGAGPLDETKAAPRCDYSIAESLLAGTGG
jgi:hypothetical protein